MHNFLLVFTEELGQGWAISIEKSKAQTGIRECAATPLKKPHYHIIYTNQT